MDTLLDELKRKPKITRDDVVALLTSIAPSGEKQDEKIAAVKELGKQNKQGIGVEQTLGTYAEF